jgi:deoxyribodipyrimidine photo-lyase
MEYAPPLEVASAKVVIGKSYPAPVVDHRNARIRALAALNTLKLNGG